MKYEQQKNQENHDLKPEQEKAQPLAKDREDDIEKGSEPDNDVRPELPREDDE